MYMEISIYIYSLLHLHIDMYIYIYMYMRIYIYRYSFLYLYTFVLLWLQRNFWCHTSFGFARVSLITAEVPSARVMAKYWPCHFDTWKISQWDGEYPNQCNPKICEGMWPVFVEGQSSCDLLVTGLQISIQKHRAWLCKDGGHPVSWMHHSDRELKKRNFNFGKWHFFP